MLRSKRKNPQCNRLRFNSIMLNCITNTVIPKRGRGYGINNYMWDDGTPLLWDNKGVVLLDK